MALAIADINDNDSLRILVFALNVKRIIRTDYSQGMVSDSCKSGKND